MKKLDAIEWFDIKGRGPVFTAVWLWDESPRTLTGESVQVGWDVYRVNGVEMLAVPYDVYKGKTFGFLVTHQYRKGVLGLPSTTWKPALDWKDDYE